MQGYFLNSVSEIITPSKQAWRLLIQRWHYMFFVKDSWLTGIWFDLSCFGHTRSSWCFSTWPTLVTGYVSGRIFPTNSNESKLWHWHPTAWPRRSWSSSWRFSAQTGLHLPRPVLEKLWRSPNSGWLMNWKGTLTMKFWKCSCPASLEIWDVTLPASQLPKPSVHWHTGLVHSTSRARNAKMSGGVHGLTMPKLGIGLGM